MYRRQTKRRQRPRNISRRLLAEQLESRRVLATFTVSTQLDTASGACVADDPTASDTCSLRVALQAAAATPGTDRIEIPAGNYPVTPAQGAFLFAQPHDVELVGLGLQPNDVVIDGQNQSRVFDLDAANAAYQVSFENLTIQNGRSNDSGGAGIFTSEAAAITLDNVVMQNNVAEINTTFGFVTSGGAIEAHADVQIDNSQFFSNGATGNGGAISLNAPDQPFAAIIRNSNFDSNVTGNINSGLGSGGAISATGGVQLTLEGASFGGNQAVNSGGGLFFSAASLAVLDSDFDSNQSLGSDGGGGGAKVATAQSVSFQGGRFFNNQSVGGGGGLELIDSPANIDLTQFQLNQVTGVSATLDGGGGGIAIINTRGIPDAVNLNGVSVDQNVAPNAGGIATINADVAIRGSTISNNRATLNGTGSFGGIGAFADFINAPLLIELSTIESNTSVFQGGGVGAIDVPLTLIGAEIRSNEAIAGAAGGVGIIGINARPILNVNGSSIYANRAGTDGAGIGVQESGFMLMNTTITGNVAANSGGGIAYNADTIPENPYIGFSTIVGNTATVGSNISMANGLEPNIEASIFAGGTGVGTFVSLGSNLDSGDSMGFNDPTDLTNTAPLLLPLADNGGPVQTIAPDPTSPVIDAAGGAVNTPLIDARGVTRPQDGDSDGNVFADIGAVEFEALTASFLTIDDVQVDETTDVAVVTVTLTGATANPFTVLAVTADDSAVADDDYTAVSETLTFNGVDGETQSFSVPIINDNDTENDEIFVISLGASSDPSVDSADTAAVTIVSDDVSTLSISDVTVNEPDGTVTIDVVLDQATPTGFAVDAFTTDVTALSGLDYTATTQTLSFLGTPGETRSFTVPILDDDENEFDETFAVGLGAASINNVVTNTTAEVTIVSEDVSTFIVDDVTVNETDSVATISVTLDRAVPADIALQVRTVEETAIAGSDYTEVVTILSFAGAANETQTFDVPIIDDAINELDETFTIQLGSVPIPTVDSTDTATVTIQSEDVSVLTVEDVTVNEIDGTATVTVMLEQATPTGFSILANTVDGTAIDGEDFTAVNTTLNFTGNANETQTFQVPILDDAINELDETFTVQLGNASIANVDSADSATVTIQSEDVSVLTVDDVTVNETDSVAVVTVTLVQSTPTAFSIPVGTIDGTAIDGDDYTAVNTTLNFAGNANETQTFQVPIIDDVINELDETFTVQLGNASIASVDSADTATVTIQSEDISVLTVEDVTVNEIDGTATVTVMLEQATPTGFSILANTVDGTAIDGEDYTATTATLNFAGNANETQTFQVPIIDDVINELDETFTVQLGNASIANVDSADTATVTIQSEDVSMLTVNDVTVNETDGVATISVTLDRVTPTGFTIPVGTVDESATAGDDYTAINTTLTFAGVANETQTFEVPIIDDVINEFDELFTILLGTPSIANVTSNGSATVTIESDDVSTLTVDDVTVDETAGTATVIVTLDRATPVGFDVPVTTSDDSAVAGQDYSTVNATLSFSGTAGETQTVSIPIIDDTLTELTESLRIALGSATFGNVITTDTAVVRILSDDVTTLLIGDVTVNETDGFATVTFRLDKDFVDPFPLDVFTVDATATAGSDYSEISTTLNFTGFANDTQSVTIPIEDDGDTEIDETFLVQVTPFSNLLDTRDAGVVTIVSEDRTAITVSDVTVNENAGTATVSIQLASDLPVALSIDATTTPGSASAGDDFVAGTTTFDFTPGGSLTRDFTVGIVDDNVFEVDEQFQINLQSPTVDLVDFSSVGLVTIVDDDITSDLVTKTALSTTTSTPLVGDTLTFVTSVTNTGPADTTGISLTNALPAGLTATVNNGAVSVGSYDPATGVWTIPNLKLDETATLTIEGIIDNGQAGQTITNTTTAAMSDRVDPTTTGDQLVTSVSVGSAIPIVAEDDSFAIDEDSPQVEFDVLSNDSPAGLTLLSVDSASLGVVSIATGGVSILYEADDDEFGMDVFRYTVQDSNGQTATADVTVNIAAVNDAPIGGDDIVDVRENGDFAIPAGALTDNDSAGPPNESGQLRLIASVPATSAEGATLDLLDNQVFYFPAPDFVGLTDSFQYTLTDGEGGFDTVDVTLNFLQNLSGRVFCDRDGNGALDFGEAVAQTRVFLDDNNNGVFDLGEDNTLTNTFGQYRFLDAEVGDATVVAEIPPSCQTIAQNPSVSRSTFDVGNLARSIAVTDREGDGDQDLLVAVDLDGSLIVLGNNSGRLSTREEISLGARPQAVTAAPALPEQPALIAVAAIGDSVDGGRIYLGNETFVEMEAGNGPIDVILDDLNSDGQLDVLSVAFRTSSLVVDPMTGDDPIELSTNSLQVLTLATGDVEDDGDQDIVVAGPGYGSGSQITVLKNNGNFDFSQQIPIDATSDLSDEYVDVEIVDLDRDGTGEVVSLSQSGTLRTFSFNGTSLQLVESLSVLDGATQFAFGDFNADEITDVAISSVTGNAVELLLGRGDATFQSIKIVDDLTTPIDLGIIDIEGDGFAEIAVLNLYAGDSAPSQLPSQVTILELDADQRAVTIDINDSTLDFVFPGFDFSQRMDVDANGEITPLDALRVINRIASQGNPSQEGELAATVRHASDVNLDGQTTPIDALLVINYLARQNEDSAALGEPTASPGENDLAVLASDVLAARDDRDDDEQAIDEVFGSGLF